MKDTKIVRIDWNHRGDGHRARPAYRAAVTVQCLEKQPYRVGSRTTVRKNSSIWRMTSMKQVKSTGLVT